jgi:hypothetical protein
MSKSVEEIRRLRQERLTAYYERKLAEILSHMRGLKSVVPVDGVVTYGTVRMSVDVRAELFHDLEKEADRLTEQALRVNDAYYQWPDGEWSLREYRIKVGAQREQNLPTKLPTDNRVSAEK